MPPTVEDRLLDILEAITKIEKLVHGQSLDQFSSDEMRRMATERYLEIVCEASRAVPGDVKREEPGIDWRKMVDFGNRLRHAYHATDVAIVWDILQNHLPILKSFVERRVHAPEQ
jgi:uncharacterized protein with HEPN domain